MGELEKSSVCRVVDNTRVRISDSPPEALERFREAAIRPGLKIRRLLSQAKIPDKFSGHVSGCQRQHDLNDSCGRGREYLGQNINAVGHHAAPRTFPSVAGFASELLRRRRRAEPCSRTRTPKYLRHMAR